MTCIEWHDDEAKAEQFFASASSEELSDAYWALFDSIKRWNVRHPPTAQRLEKLQGRLDEVGYARFGDDYFNIPW